MSVEQHNAADNLTRRDYFAVALSILAQRGFEELTISELCQRLGVTKGSFYHHFGGTAGFVDGLLGFWEAEHAQRLIAVSQAERDAAERIDLLKHIGADLPHEAEGAIRAWSRGNAKVAEVVARVDGAREQHLVEAIVDVGVEPDRAAVLARLGLAILVGVQQLEHPVDHERLLAVLGEYQRWLIAVVGGRAP